MAKNERELLIENIAADLADISGFGTPAYRKQFEERARDIIRDGLARLEKTPQNVEALPAAQR